MEYSNTIVWEWFLKKKIGGLQQSSQWLQTDFCFLKVILLNCQDCPMLHEKCFPVIVLIASLNTCLKMIWKPVLTDWGCHLLFLLLDFLGQNWIRIHFRIKVSKKGLRKRSNVAVTSFSSDKWKNWLSVYIVWGDKIQQQ